MKSLHLLEDYCHEWTAQWFTPKISGNSFLQRSCQCTISTYCSYLSQFLSWFEESFPDRLVDSVTWEELRSYARYLKEIRVLNSRTVNVHIAQLRDFFQYILHRDWDRYQLPYLRFDEKLPNVPTKEQINRIIDSISNLKHKTEISLLYSSGIRVSELCRLRCQDIYH